MEFIPFCGHFYNPFFADLGCFWRIFFLGANLAHFFDFLHNLATNMDTYHTVHFELVACEKKAKKCTWGLAFFTFFLVNFKSVWSKAFLRGELGSNPTLEHAQWRAAWNPLLRCLFSHYITSKYRLVIKPLNSSKAPFGSPITPEKITSFLIVTH